MTSTSRKPSPFAVLTGIFLLIPHLVLAGEVTRKVNRGESLSFICQEVYGDKDLYTLVALYNGKEDPTRINPGETLRLPYSDTVTLRKGESLSILARRIWSEPGMYPVLAWANGIQDVAKVPVGTRLAVPVLVPYTLKRGESISSVAGGLYGNPKVYEVIVNASQIEDPARVPAGTQLKIPYVMPRAVVKKMSVRTEPKQAPRPDPKPVVKKPEPDQGAGKAMVLLDEAENAFREGRYGDAWTLADQAAEGLGGKERAGAYRLMAATQYAFGKNEAALEDLVRAHELDPDFVPDPAYVNPEMRALYERAREK